MPFTPFDQNDFELMISVQEGEQLPSRLLEKISALLEALGAYPEFNLNFFRTRIVRRPEMRGNRGLVFGPARTAPQHWYTYVVGGDQDQVQLNIGMWTSHIRVGLGFMIGRQVHPKIPAFHLFRRSSVCARRCRLGTHSSSASRETDLPSKTAATQ